MNIERKRKEMEFGGDEVVCEISMNGGINVFMNI